MLRTDFTDQEWESLQAAPGAVGLVVMMSEPGLLGIPKELKAIVQSASEFEQAGAARDLVTELMDGMGDDDADGSEDSTGDETGQDESAGAAREELLDNVRAAKVVIEQKLDPQTAAGFSNWLMHIGREVAKAAKSGSVLGFGGKRVTEAEVAAVAEIAGILGVAEIGLQADE